MLTIKLWTTSGFNTILFIETISLFFVVSGLVTEIGTQLLGPSQGSLDRLPFTYYSNLWYSGLIAICWQIVFFLRPLVSNGPSKSNITSNVSTNDSFWINGQLTSDKEELIPIIGNNFTVIYHDMRQNLHSRRSDNRDLFHAKMVYWTRMGRTGTS